MAGVVVLLLAGATALFVGTGSTGVAVGDLHRGDCLTSGSLGQRQSGVSDVAVVSCGHAHVAQVVATATRQGSTPAQACVQAITDVGTSVAALAVSGRQVRPLSAGDHVACLVVGRLSGSVVPGVAG